MNEFLTKSTQILELHTVLSRLADHAVSAGAKAAALALAPLENPREIEQRLKEVTEACAVSVTRGNPSFYGVKDVRPSLVRAQRDGVLTMRELLDIASLIRATRSVRDYRVQGEGELSIDEYFSLLHPDTAFERAISDAILSEDELADTASPTLSQIRRKIKNAHARVRDILARLLATQAGKALQEALITQRSGRYVLPVKAEHKNEVPGLVHDISSSGATVFIEPMAVVEANNEISVLQGEEKKEIERILTEFSAAAAERADSLNLAYDTLVKLDLIFAKAKLSYDMEGIAPLLNEKGYYRLKKARHPLLEKKTAVPVDIELGGSYDTLIITGPNTGGKTVSLKTLGLLTLMACCGLHVPAADGSTLPVANVYADIGDEQSIEQSLSTFSSHMKSIVEILAQADQNSLILFDELGAGTDPVEGAALAIAIIERAASLGARIAATTHYAELKVYALNTQGVENASCEFDVETLRPTYRLLTGIPGRSNAFAISKRLGLDEDVIEHARGLVGSEAGRFEDVIDRLESNRQQMEEEKRKAEALRREIEELTLRARDREKRYEQEREKASARARAEAEEIVDRARAEADEILDEVRALRKRIADQAVENVDFNALSSDMKRKFNRLEDSISPSIARDSVATPPSRPIVAGDRVKLIKMNATGTVITPPDKDGNMLVQAGVLKINLKLSDAELIEDAPKAKKPTSGGVSFTKSSIKDSAAANRLDIRGMAADEAITELEAFLDVAIRQKLPAATIVHGKGTGKLRDTVRAHLRRNRMISSYRPGVYGEGEDGVTIVEF